MPRSVAKADTKTTTGNLALDAAVVMSQLDQAKVDYASLKCTTFERAIEAYMLHPKADDKPPMNLMVLVLGDKALGIPPMVEGGEKALQNPWGGSFEFEMIHDGFRDAPKVTAKAPNGQIITSPKWAVKAKK